MFSVSVLMVLLCGRAKHFVWVVGGGGGGVIFKMLFKVPNETILLYREGGRGYFKKQT